MMFSDFLGDRQTDFIEMVFQVYQFDFIDVFNYE